MNFLVNGLKYSLFGASLALAMTTATQAEIGGHVEVPV